jgi:trimethylamine---corrinoid protein Co-methyltransferase
MRGHTTWLSEDEKRLIYEQSLAVLESTGLRIPGSGLLPCLREAGAHVDEESGLVHFPSELVEAALRQCPREFVMAGLTSRDDVHVGDGKFHFATGGCVAHAIDLETGERRPSTLEDVRLATALLDEMPELEVMWTIATANDVEVERRELVEYQTILSTTRKHVTFVDCPHHVKEAKEIFAVLAGDLASFAARPRVSTLMTIASPLQVDGRLLDAHAELSRCGAPLKIYTMGEAGATSPVSLAGTVTQGLAEFLGCTTALQAAVPGAPVIFCFGAGVLDMRTTTFALGSLENTLMGCMAVEMAHYVGVPCLAPSIMTEAKEPGTQAGVEKGLKAFPICAAGPDVTSGGMGLLDTSSVLFLPQVVIDHELMRMVRAMLGEVEVSLETTGAELIARVGQGGTFLRERDTRDRVRAGEHFVPEVFTRQSYDQWKRAGRGELGVARALMDDALRMHEQRDPYLTCDQRAELERICGR